MDIDIFTRGDVEAVSQIAINKSLRENKNPLIVTVGIFQGGKDSRQGAILKAAAANVKSYYLSKRNIDVRFECLTNDDVINRKKWIPSLLFDWLRRKDIHVIPTHGHQSNIARGQVGFYWTVPAYLRNLNTLKFHLGYPMGKYIKCPVFQQHKMEYLKDLRQYCTPTIATVLPYVDPHNGGLLMDEYEISRVSEFVVEHSSTCDNKFIGNCDNFSLLYHIHK